LRYSEDLDGEDIEALKDKLLKFKKARNELEEFDEISETELVQLWNCCPVSILLFNLVYFMAK
jgi:hypothetical protein